MNNSKLLQTYQQHIENGDIIKDDKQIDLLQKFDLFLQELHQHKSVKKGFLSRFLKKKPLPSPKGFYIYGDVGRGKTMLMDLLFQNLPEVPKKRVHFHDFMRDIHLKVHQHRQDFLDKKTTLADPIPFIANQISQEAKVICFDEFTVTDIADAMILSRLFTKLFENGLIFIATSNVAPDNLYKNGLSRAVILPFIEVLKNNVEIYSLNGPTDYRLSKQKIVDSYLWPLNKENQEKFEKNWQEHLKKFGPEKQIIFSVMGHDIIIKHATEKAVRFDFQDLCQKPLAANDYLALAQKYEYFYIENIPIFDDDMRNIIKRFILLIDVLYDHHKITFILAEAAPINLYPGSSKFIEKFEFERTVSRLTEMQSPEYNALLHEI